MIDSPVNVSQNRSLYVLSISFEYMKKESLLFINKQISCFFGGQLAKGQTFLSIELKKRGQKNHIIKANIFYKKGL